MIIRPAALGQGAAPASESDQTPASPSTATSLSPPSLPPPHSTAPRSPLATTASCLKPPAASSSAACADENHVRVVTHRAADAELSFILRESTSNGSSRSRCPRMLVPASMPLCTSHTSVTPNASQDRNAAPQLYTSAMSSSTTTRPPNLRSASASSLLTRVALLPWLRSCGGSSRTTA